MLRSNKGINRFEEDSVHEIFNNDQANLHLAGPSLDVAMSWDPTEQRLTVLTNERTLNIYKVTFSKQNDDDVEMSL